MEIVEWKGIDLVVKTQEVGIGQKGYTLKYNHKYVSYL